jgi:predicted HicB family RNase H-like nuclease
MNADSKNRNARSLDRINLRLAGDISAEIDFARAAPAGHVSLNTWIAEAIEDKLSYERTATTADDGEHRAHG